MKFRQLCNPHQHPNSLDTGAPLKEFIKRDKELGSGCTTMTDHGSLGGAIDFYNYAKKQGIQPVIGLEAYLYDENCPILKGAGIKDTKEYNKYYHLTMHCQDYDAYLTLVKLLTKADIERGEWHGTEKKPLFNWTDLEELGAKNVTFCSSCLAGVCSNHFKQNNPQLGEQYYSKLRSIVGPDKFFVEVFPHVTSHYYQQGMFVTFEDGKKEKFSIKGTCRVGEEEVKNADLHKHVGKYLTGRKSYSWIDLEPRKIVNAVLVKDFIQNECTPLWPDGDLQLHCNKKILELAEKYGDRVMVSLDSHYSTKEYKEVQEIKLFQSGWGPFYGNYHIQSSDECYAYFKTKLGIDEKTFEGWIDNSYEWADKFKNFSIPKQNLLPKSMYPKDTVSHLYNLVEKHGRYNPDNAVMRSRLEREVELFAHNGSLDLLPYFFTAEDFCAAHSEKGILCGPGRGSAGGVLISYLLGITHVNPLKHNLSLDRFLTLDRIKSGKMPDIDTDFADRDWLFEDDGYLEKRFKGKYAQIATVAMMKLKSSIKDVFRQKYKEVPYNIMKFAESLPDEPQGIPTYDFVFGYEDTDKNHVQGLIEKSAELRQFTKNYPLEWEAIVRCLGVTRSRGVHACLPAGELILTKNGDYQDITKCSNRQLPTGQGNSGKAVLIPNGKKKVFEFTLENGKTVKCTADHRVLTTKGWMEIQEAFVKNADLVNPLL